MNNDILTPLHPGAIHKHKIYKISEGYEDARGRPYKVYSCRCGMAMEFVPLGTWIG